MWVNRSVQKNSASQLIANGIVPADGKKVSPLLDIFVDADACPVKQEIFRVAKRYGLKVLLVSNSWMRIPDSSCLELVVVDKGKDVADDWIVEHAGIDDIVISGDIPLASQCIKKGAQVLGNTGRPFTEDNIGNALSVRNLLSDLREQGIVTGGPKPFAKKDRSRFLQALDEIIVKIRRRNGIRS
ncbi:MAG: YaiI/YqxD family protein [Candidatus Sabulitectum sp.]|nr:YaiI/YqxD family protein [Candidatus Sabulitectum sp.]